MKLSANKIDNYIATNLDKIKAILLYGPDKGLIDTRSDKIINIILGENPDPFLHIKFNSKKIQDDNALLIDEANSVSFIPGRKIIQIDESNNNISKQIEECLDNLKADSFLLIKASELTPASKLRKLAEQRNDILAAPCYIDDYFALLNIIREESNKLELRLNNEQIQYIASNLSGNRLILINELKKLKLFLSEKNEISNEEIANLICSSKEENYQEIVNYIAAKDIFKAQASIERHLKQGVYLVPIVRSIANYFNKLYLVKSKLAANENLESSLKLLRPPLFFKQKDLFISHLNKWNIKEINYLNNLLLRLESMLKSDKMIYAEPILYQQIQIFNQNR